ncbi:hypothetical protein P170DRAFT_433265 [Aspergillus steynii IBT 23096]|uniref:Uncharacterized protein n=1 Tax=Aspergillus steynii IBT 23096 TaxID=1392250 RepID=A0A2I2GSC6_9EURO|nr:uncharacterized protein P170DRAFT_433265 [Aspergillus steynii IBT 23096]PLB55770.1 hypothetical protein P170DRAFT_433265 [Aspergillus steynii IBT 23096]
MPTLMSWFRGPYFLFPVIRHGFPPAETRSSDRLQQWQPAIWSVASTVYLLSALSSSTPRYSVVSLVYAVYNLGLVPACVQDPDWSPYAGTAHWPIGPVQGPTVHCFPPPVL